MELPLEWTSKHRTPSPRSSRLAESLLASSAFVPKPLERDVHQILADGLVLFTDRAELEFSAVLDLVESLGARLEHLLHPGGDVDVHGLHLLDGLTHAEQVPGAEGPCLVGEAPLHR